MLYTWFFLLNAYKVDMRLHNHFVSPHFEYRFDVFHGNIQSLAWVEKILSVHIAAMLLTLDCQATQIKQQPKWKDKNGREKEQLLNH